MSARQGKRAFWPLVVGAGVGLLALVGGLVALRKHRLGAPEEGALPAALTAPSARSGTLPPLAPSREGEGSRQDAGVRALRSVLPAHAWVVVDVDLSLLNAAGFANSSALRPLDCDQVPPPARLALALVPETTGKEGTSWPGATTGPLPSGVPDLVVAALGASSAFRECAKRKLLAEGGKEIPGTGGFRIVENRTRTRLLVNDERDLVLFATASAPATDTLISVASGVLPNAEMGPHHVLAESLGARALGLTAALPKNWLERAGGGPEAKQSPLSAMESAALGVRVDGTLEARILCAADALEDGCPMLARFLLRAKDDLLQGLSNERREALARGFSLETSPHALHLVWHIAPSDVGALLAPLLGN